MRRSGAILDELLRFGAIVFVVAGCYSPTVQPGAPCGPNGECPTGLVCAPTTDRCERPGGGELDAPPNDPDGPLAIDAPRIDGPPGVTCYGALHAFCPDPEAVPDTRSFTTSTTIDTSQDSQCDAIVDGICAVFAKRISVGGTVRGVGARPLALVAIDTLTVTSSGLLDVASTQAKGRGAGADPAACTPGMAPFGQGGGYGGTFGGLGGNGGDDGVATSEGGIPPAVGGVPNSLRGGCRGGLGIGSADTQHGFGGGAVYLVAGQMLSISGTINASGAGGAGCPGNAGSCGGSGGGSGGMIVIDAPTVQLTNAAEVFANGGGGGEGGGSLPGFDGDDPTTAKTRAQGGGGASFGGEGGDGSAGNEAAGTNATNGQFGASGGGGGGGAGVIRIFGTSTVNGDVSPPPS